MAYTEILGWSTDDKVPGFYAQNKSGAGRVSIGSIPICVACTGTKTSDGSMTPDQDIDPVYSADDAMAKAGPRSMLFQQAEAAFTVPGVNVVLAPPAEASAAVAATIVLTIAGTWTTDGELLFYVNGKPVQTTILSTHTPTTAAAAVVTSSGAVHTLPATAGYTAGAVTLTCASKGTQGNLTKLVIDKSLLPSGCTVTVSGGTLVSQNMWNFAGGTGTEDLTELIDLLETGVYDYLAIAQTDATNAGLIKAHVESEKQPTIAHLESAVFGSTDTLANAGSFASSTLNHDQCAVIWYEHSETHPAVLAANAAAYRASVVGANPNSIYAGKALKGVVKQRYREHVPNHSVLKAALNTGLTPLKFEDGWVRIVRDCVSKCRTGDSPDFRTYGWPDVDVPFRMRKELGALYLERREDNPYVGPDALAGENEKGPGVETPSSFKAAATALWKFAERENWICDVDMNPLIIEYNRDRKSLVGRFPVVVRPQNLAMGSLLEQRAS